jgi:hypothetical protein
LPRDVRRRDFENHKALHILPLAPSPFNIPRWPGEAAHRMPPPGSRKTSMRPGSPPTYVFLPSRAKGNPIPLSPHGPPSLG